MEYPYVMDLHTHTIASGHAYSSLREMARGAAEKGIEILGIAEHAPKMPGTCGLFYFQNLKIVPRELEGVRLLLGAEVNIMDYNGKVDLGLSVLKHLDHVVASLHTPCINPGTKEENTSAYLNAMKNPYINIIGHPDDSRYPIDYLALVQAAKEYGKLLEVNNHSLDPDCTRQNAWENYREMLSLCKKYQVPIIVDTDSHFDTQIADVPYALQLLNEMEFPVELVVNRSVDALRGWVNCEI